MLSLLSLSKGLGPPKLQPVVVALFFLLLGCQSDNSISQVSTPTTVPDNWVTLENQRTEFVFIENVPIPLENCSGSAPVNVNINRNRSTTTSIELTLGGSVEAGISKIVQAKIETSLTIQQGEQNSFGLDVQVSVEPQKQVIYELIWNEAWQVGEAFIEELDLRIPYRVRTGLQPVLNSGNLLPCSDEPTKTSSPVPTTNQVPSETATLSPSSSPTHTKAPTNTSIPTSTVTLTATSPSIAEASTQLCENEFDIPMVMIPATNYSMGASAGDLSAQSDERPQREVSVSAFCIDMYEVTNALYTSCVNEDVCTPPQRVSSATRADYFNSPIYARFPVVNITWQQAQTYCEYRGGRLPTEAEWELVARYEPQQQSLRAYAWGDEIPDNTTANYAALGLGDVIEVGQKPEGRSAFDIYDLNGNATEWVLDWYGNYRRDDNNNPKGPQAGNERVVRGGSFRDQASDIRSGARGRQSPNVPSSEIGFRCVIPFP